MVAVLIFFLGLVELNFPQQGKAQEQNKTQKTHFRTLGFSTSKKQQQPGVGLAQENLPIPRHQTFEFRIQGLLASDPAYIESQRIYQELLALAARANNSRGNLEPIQSEILLKIRLLRPSGRPIDDRHLIPLLQAIQRVRTSLNSVARNEVDTWLRSVISVADQSHRQVSPQSQTLRNNHETWRLCVRSIVAVILGDNEIIAETTRLFSHHVQLNLPYPDGRSIDFVQRDALHYHVYNLEAYLYALTFAPPVLGAQERNSILRAIEFLRPFYLGRAIHIEFQNSQVAFDRTRGQNNETHFQVQPYDSSRMNSILNMARPLFPQLTTWVHS